jgi:hypothetical protein
MAIRSYHRVTSPCARCREQGRLPLAVGQGQGPGSWPQDAALVAARTKGVPAAALCEGCSGDLTWAFGY